MLQVSLNQLQHDLHYYSQPPQDYTHLSSGGQENDEREDQSSNNSCLIKTNLKSSRNTRRYQPYSTNKPATTNSNIMDQPLFGPISSSSSNSNNSFDLSCSTSSSDSALILDDSEIFDEFDDFTHSPSLSERYLSSPPPSPILSPSNDEEQDFDFGDFPLFP